MYEQYGRNSLKRKNEPIYFMGCLKCVKSLLKCEFRKIPL